MTFKQFKENKVIKFLSNRYVLILLLFLIWIIFFDENSYLLQRELNKEINEIEKTNKYYKRETGADKKAIENFKNSDSFEKFAREEYKMKRKDEDIYIIEFDSVKK